MRLWNLFTYLVGFVFLLSDLDLLKKLTSCCDERTKGHCLVCR